MEGTSARIERRWVKYLILAGVVLSTVYVL